MDRSISNFLQVFADSKSMNLNVDEINRLTAARKEFIKKASEASLDDRVAIAKSILRKYKLDSIEILNIDFKDYKSDIDKFVKENLKNKDIDERAIQEAQDFSLRVLNADIEEFSRFIDYLNELANVDINTITKETEDIHQLQIDSIIGFDMYDNYLVHGSVYDNTSTVTNALYDMSIYLTDYSKDDITANLPLIKDYYDELINIGEFIRKSADLTISQDELDNKYNEALEKHDNYVNDIEEYNSLFFHNKLVNRMFKKDRKKEIPEALLKMLPVHALEQFLDTKHGFSLREEHRNVVNNSKDQEELNKMVNEDSNKKENNTSIDEYTK